MNGWIHGRFLIDSGPIHTPAHQGTLLVNVASYCALTPQYPALEALYEQFHDQGFEVVGVGCNQFGGQEPEKVREMCVLFGPFLGLVQRLLTPVSTPSSIHTRAGRRRWRR